MTLKRWLVLELIWLVEMIVEVLVVSVVIELVVELNPIDMT